MNRYYIELQNKLTDRIRIAIAEMNKNVYELSNENKKLQQKIDKAITHIKNFCIDDEFYINLTRKEKCIIDVLKILGDE